MKAKTKAQKIIGREMEKFEEGRLHSGSKKGPVVKSKKQALAISLDVARKKGAKIKKKNKD